MRKKYIHPTYKRDVLQKFQHLPQGSKSVDDYYKEMETLMEKADIDEDEETTMARFLEGMNKELAQMVDLQDYKEIDQMLHKARKLESRLKSRSTGVKFYTPTTPWKPKPLFPPKANMGANSNFKKSTPTTSSGNSPKPS